MYISQITLKNIRGFRNLDLRITDSRDRPRMRTVIIGRNGTNKTTLLRCIALGVSGLSEASGLLAEPNGPLVANGRKVATIQIELSDAGKRRRTVVYKKEIHRTPSGETIVDKSPNGAQAGTLLVCGYGAVRGATTGEETGRAYRIDDSVYTMFRYGEPLVGVELILRRLNDFLGSELYSATLKAIKRTLGLSRSHEIQFEPGGGVTVSGPGTGKKIPIEAWADGFRITFAMIMDVYGWALRAEHGVGDGSIIDDKGNISGILLIDEIEQHLHPSLQATLLPNLSRLFKNMQLFVATHSPIATAGADHTEVVVLRRRGNTITAGELVPDFSGYSYEDVLTAAELFDTPRYAQRGIQQLLRRWRRITDMPVEQRTQEQTLELHDLGRRIRLSQPEMLDPSMLLELRRIREALESAKV